ncbi:S4 domain-containing protein [Dermabacter sp. Marseille-Q3180]|uniref:RNA-binding S4 domain-containing protein n=1 Tax=Dermabacter sp. Marseille-Q3180 TaxID=2758090 RepID=UPI0020247966|nr:S4 domain-containing protein [Dermabacter sp. Marseille-Q3180]
MNESQNADAGNGNVRLDSWLHAVRLFKTRSLASSAIKASHVRVDGEVVKPSFRLNIGSTVAVRHPGYTNEYVVKKLLAKRVGAPLAREAYTDISAPPPPQLFAAPPRRARGAGRPTKKERRALDRLRGRESQNGRWRAIFDDNES